MTLQQCSIDVLHPREACPIAEPGNQYLYLTGNWYDSTSSKVIKYGLDGFREELPSLNKGRWDHGCSGYYNEDNKFVLLVTGGFVKNPGRIWLISMLPFDCCLIVIMKQTVRGLLQRKYSKSEYPTDGWRCLPFHPPWPVPWLSPLTTTFTS